MLLVEKHQQRRLMVVALFISTLVTAIYRLSMPNSNSGENINFKKDLL
jgi:hypothetical protein